jgi:hexosaminidase
MLVSLLSLSSLALASSSALSLNADPASGLSLLPVPKSVQVLQKPALRATKLTGTVSCDFGCDIAQAALKRYLSIINADLAFATRYTGGRGVPGATECADVHVSLTAKAPVALDKQVEMYNLTIGVDETHCVAISAQDEAGAVRGLETLSQLVNVSAGPVFPAVAIEDEPRFTYRAFLVDTSRHYITMPSLYAVIDALAYNKFNVMHWHIVDSEAFPFVSSTFADLSGKGAYAPDHVYNASDVAAIIKYASLRGIRVVPEFDTPGHVDPSWGAGYPFLLTGCPNVFDGLQSPIYPIAETTYDFLTKFFAEVASTFPDTFLHMGGDEVVLDCWKANNSIAEWMARNNYTQYSDVETYYESRLVDIIGGLGKSYAVWQEVFDNGVKIKGDTIVDVWKTDPVSWPDELAAVTAAGYQAILTAPWYLNYISYGEDWPKYYLVEPTNFTGTQEQKDRVIGGSGAMWGEFVDSTNIVSRIFPRAAAIAERLWSPASVRDMDSATRRMHSLQCRLIRRGIRAEPANGPSFCEQEWVDDYRPPFEM